MMPARRPDIAIREPRERLVASVRTRCHPSQLRQTIASAQDEVLDVIGAEGLAPAGPMFTRYHRIGPIAELEVGVPLAQTVRPHPRVLNSTLPGGPAVHAVCMGSRVKLVQTVSALYEYLKGAGLTASGGYWEYYLTDSIPGLDRSQVEFYLPIVGIHTNGRRSKVPTEPVAIPIQPEEPALITAGHTSRSILARHGPRWEEGGSEVEVAATSDPRSSNSTDRAGASRTAEEPDASTPEP